MSVGRSLWLHLVSVHDEPLALVRTEAENRSDHEERHQRGGTHGVHVVSDLGFYPEHAKAVLSQLWAEETGGTS